MLETGYRVPRQILDFASQLLDQIAPGLGAARSVRQDAGALQVSRSPRGSLTDALIAACADALTRPGSAAVIAADAQLPAGRRADRSRPAVTSLATRSRPEPPPGRSSPWCR